MASTMLESHFKFLTIVTHLIYRILTFGTTIWNEILFKFEDNKKQTLSCSKKTNKLCFKKNFSFLNR